MKAERSLASGADGSKLFVEDWGTVGTHVVLGHGFGGSARNFRPQAKQFSNHHRVTLFDARGHARSEAPEIESEYEPAKFVADIGCLLDAIGADRAVIGGLSMGAGLALRFALAHPERVQGLVLAAFPRSRDQPGHVEWALGFADAIEREGLDAAGARFAWGERAGRDPKGADLIRRGFLEHRPLALACILRRVLSVQPGPTEIAAALRAFTGPALVIVGSEDPPSLSGSRALAELLPNAELVIVPGGGHVINLTNPGDYNQALERFLTRIG